MNLTQRSYVYVNDIIFDENSKATHLQTYVNLLRSKSAVLKFAVKSSIYKPMQIRGC